MHLSSVLYRLLNLFLSLTNNIYIYKKKLLRIQRVDSIFKLNVEWIFY